jgi:hypothetical protein
MSNYHYNDQGSCTSCLNKSDYSDLNNLASYSCNQKCICRGTGERSTKDKMDYQFYVLNKPVMLGQLNSENPNKKNC